jgi:prepilin-type N-terminal cleavage/methylation domain-containing protein
MSRIELHRAQRGFTLVELIVVIAILGVLVSVSVPAMRSYLGSSKEQAYNADLSRFQLAVDSFLSNPSNTRFLGKRQYPIFGTDKSTGTLVQEDADTTAETLTIAGNPLGGSQGGGPEWTDGGNGIRDSGEEVLNDEDSATSAGWHVASVTRQGTEYIVDSRDYLIDFDKLVADGYLDKVPGSASTDNKPSGSTNTYSGSYSWYVGSDGRVKSLYFFFPESDQTGFQDVFP